MDLVWEASGGWKDVTSCSQLPVTFQSPSSHHSPLTSPGAVSTQNTVATDLPYSPSLSGAHAAPDHFIHLVINFIIASRQSALTILARRLPASTSSVFLPCAMRHVTVFGREIGPPPEQSP